MEKSDIDNYLEKIKIKKNNEKQKITTVSLFEDYNSQKSKNSYKTNEENIIIIDTEISNNKNKDTLNDLGLIEDEEIKKDKKELMVLEEDNENLKEEKENIKLKDSISEEKVNRINKEEKTIEENESKKGGKNKKRVRGPNKCYRVIDDFFNDKKRTKDYNQENNKLKYDAQNKTNDELTNTEEKNKKAKKRIKIIEMSEKFDEFLEYVKERVNTYYYDFFVFPVINRYKEFYLEKEKEYKENKKNMNEEKENTINIDENLARRKKSYGLENFLEIPEIVNEFVKYIYNKNIFVTDESKIEMIEIIFIFCTWLKQYHYSSYSIEYLIKNEEEK